MRPSIVSAFAMTGHISFVDRMHKALWPKDSGLSHTLLRTRRTETEISSSSRSQSLADSRFRLDALAELSRN